MSDRFESFEEFWPHYVHEHADPRNRKLHFVGTTGVLAIAATAAIMRRPKLLLAAPLAGYGCAWVGHFFVEKNRPATFTHPLWSLRGDFVMYFKMLTGQMETEVSEATAAAQNHARETNGQGRSHGVAPNATATTHPN